MVYTIKSQKLNRTIYVAEKREEARELAKKLPKDDRGSIYLSSEIEAMKGQEVDIHRLQMVKDVFPGAIIERVDRACPDIFQRDDAEGRGVPEPHTQPALL